MEGADVIMQSPDEIKDNPEALDQIEKLLMFLQPTLGNTEKETIIEQYQQTWLTLEAAPLDLQGMWYTSGYVDHAYTGDTIKFWKSLHEAIVTQFTTAMTESLAELGHSEELDLYNLMLKKRLDKCVGYILHYIGLLEDHEKIVEYPDDYGEDERDMTDKVIASTARDRAKYFMDLIVFMFVVQRRSPERWDSLEPYSRHWFDFQIRPCKFYQGQEQLMSFLSDCAVVMLLTGNFEFGSDIKNIYLQYIKLQRILVETLSAMRDKDNKELRHCAVCYVNTRDVILFPCEHFLLCHKCAFNPKFVKDNRCPLCFQTIKEIKSVQTLVKDNKIDFQQNTQLPKQSICSLLTRLSIIR